MKSGTQTILFHWTCLTILLHMAQVAENIANMINVMRKSLISSTPIGSSSRSEWGARRESYSNWTWLEGRTGDE